VKREQPRRHLCMSDTSRILLAVSAAKSSLMCELRPPATDSSVNSTSFLLALPRPILDGRYSHLSERCTTRTRDSCHRYQRQRCRQTRPKQRRTAGGAAGRGAAGLESPLAKPVRLAPPPPAPPAPPLDHGNTKVVAQTEGARGRGGSRGRVHVGNGVEAVVEPDRLAQGCGASWHSVSRQQRRWRRRQRWRWRRRHGGGGGRATGGRGWQLKLVAGLYKALARRAAC
jgi:hypothetical protein